MAFVAFGGFGGSTAAQAAETSAKDEEPITAERRRGEADEEASKTTATTTATTSRKAKKRGRTESKNKREKEAIGFLWRDFFGCVEAEDNFLRQALFFLSSLLPSVGFG